MLQWQKIHAGDWHAKMLENSFIFVVPGAAFLELSMPKSYEINKIEQMHRKNIHPCVAMIEY